MSSFDTWAPSEVRTHLRQLLRRAERGDCDRVADMFAWVDKPGVLPAPVDWLRKIQEFSDSLPSEKWNPIIRVEAALVGEKPGKEIVFSLLTYSANDPEQRVANLAAIYRFVSEGKVDNVHADYFALSESWLPQCRTQAIECLSDWIDLLESPSYVQSTQVRDVLAPGDRLFPDERCFIWGGHRYERLTRKMIDILRVFVEQFEAGFPNVTLQLIESKTGIRFDGAFISQAFKQNRKGEPNLHPAHALIEAVGRGEYRLIEPKKLKI